jgi:hypothetical protein
MEFRTSLYAILLGVCTSLPLPPSGEQLKNLPTGVLTALHTDEEEYCRQFLKKDCHRIFRANLPWRELVISPTDQTAILVENHNMGFCGSLGCSLYLFLSQKDGKYIQVLGTQGETGALSSIKLLETVTNGHRDLQKTWRDDEMQTIYKWNGMRYVAK